MHWSDEHCERAIRDALDTQLDEGTIHLLLDEGRGMTVEHAAREHRQENQSAHVILLPRAFPKTY